MEPAVGMTEGAISSRSNSNFYRSSNNRNFLRGSSSSRRRRRNISSRRSSRNIFRSSNRHSGISSIRFPGDGAHRYVRDAANPGMALPITPLRRLFSQHPSRISKQIIQHSQVNTAAIRGRVSPSYPHSQPSHRLTDMSRPRLQMRGAALLKTGS